jgi:hypothetical protein
MNKDTIVSLINRHATIDSSVLTSHKDQLIEVACQDNSLAPEAAKALLRVELAAEDLDLITSRLRSTTDYDNRLFCYALLSKYHRIERCDLEMLEQPSAILSDQQQFFWGVIARHCKLPWASPVVQALVNRTTSESDNWSRHIHTLGCLLGYLDHPSLFELAANVQRAVAEDRLLSAAIGFIISSARKR